MFILTTLSDGCYGDYYTIYDLSKVENYTRGFFCEFMEELERSRVTAICETKEHAEGYVYSGERHRIRYYTWDPEQEIWLHEET
jgi:hypothetical protein